MSEQRMTLVGNGYTGRILRVNLSTRTCQVENLPDDFYRVYLGGWGFIAYYLLREVPAGADPLGPENKLIFAPGVVTGTALAGSGRHAVGAKSPLTGGFGAAESGGFWGAELKRAGFDAVIVEGVAVTPTYLWIHDGEAEMRDATALWGKPTKEAQAAIWHELGDGRVRISQIGPGGEHLVRYACIVNELRSAAGRCGLGAVMGSKKLKAVAVRGTGRVGIADKERIAQVNAWLRANYRELNSALVQLGTGARFERYSDAGQLPTRNSRYGSFGDASKISATAIRDRIRVSMDGCYACPIKCKKVVKAEMPYSVDPAYGGPEYETLAALGSYVGVGDLLVVAKANELCNAYTLDTMSTGGSIAFVMECFERGILTTADTGGLVLRWGNGEAVLALIEQIAHREGFGDFVAQGVKRMAERLGPETRAFANHVKGQEVAYWEPRAMHGLGIGYAVSPTGADHVHSLLDANFAATTGRLRDLGVLAPIPVNDLGPAKVRMHLYAVDDTVLDNCLGMCYLFPYHVNHIVDAVNGITGWNTSSWELLKGAERVLTMARAYNLREGLGAADDVLPPRMHTPYLEGPCPAGPIDEEALARAKRLYYEMMGWDGETGVPLEARLHELNIGWVAEVLKR